MTPISCEFGGITRMGSNFESLSGLRCLVNTFITVFEWKRVQRWLRALMNAEWRTCLVRANIDPAIPLLVSLPPSMWTRKQRTGLCVALAAIVIVLLCSTSERIAEKAPTVASIQEPFTAWRNMIIGHDDSPTRLHSPHITETSMPGSQFAEGFTIFDRLYVRNGTFFVVTSRASMFPKIKNMISQPGDLDKTNRDPTDQEMRFITPEESETILGKRAIVISGLSVVLTDSKQFMSHYYHWWGEIILGAIRMYSSLPSFSGTLQVQPSRFILPDIVGYTWRDPAGVNGPLMRAGFPDAPIETKDFWEDLIDLDRTFVFEQVILVNRIAAHKSPLLGNWQKMIASTMNVTVPPLFWEPLRKRLVRNTVGILPIMDSTGAVVSPPRLRSSSPIVTYISRQGGHRRLSNQDHDHLVSTLLGLEEEGLCEFDVVRMETLSFSQQVEVAARTTIMIGVHGNGLTHQLWMPPSPRSTVIEMFFPQTYLHDYEILAQNMGHKHYAIWNDTALTYPPGEWFPGIKSGNRNDLHGDSIPVNGATVAQVIRERLALTST